VSIRPLLLFGKCVLVFSLIHFQQRFSKITYCTFKIHLLMWPYVPFVFLLRRVKTDTD